MQFTLLQLEVLTLALYDVFEIPSGSLWSAPVGFVICFFIDERRGEMLPIIFYARMSDLLALLSQAWQMMA